MTKRTETVDRGCEPKSASLRLFFRVQESLALCEGVHSLLYRLKLLAKSGCRTAERAFILRGQAIEHLRDVIPAHLPVDPKNEERLVVRSQRLAQLVEAVLHLGSQVGKRSRTDPIGHFADSRERLSTMTLVVR